MTRIMRDSTNANNIPTDTPIVAGYVNGHYAWSQAWWDRFPGVWRHAGIDVFGTAPHVAGVLDIEQYDATPAIAVEWVKARNAIHPGYPPVLYVNRDNRSEVERLQRDAGHVLGKDYKLWVATLDGTQHLSDMNGVVAIQYRDFGGYDESIVFDDAWHAAPAPVKPPVKPPVTDPDITEAQVRAWARAEIKAVLENAMHGL